MMANEELVKVLVYTDVTRYIEFKLISRSMVCRDGKIKKVPATVTEAGSSPLLGFFEKFKVKKFLEFVSKWKKDDVSTHQGLNLEKQPMSEIFAHFGLDASSQEFIGHAMALHLNEDYKDRPANETFEKIVLYVSSVARYGSSPYIYPLYGLGELPQGFARLSAIYGGTYMLGTPIDEVIYGEDGKVTGVKSGEQVAKAKLVIGDPSYFKEKVKKTGQVIRTICLLDHPIPNSDNADSTQIIIPQNQAKRKHDIYITSVSASHHVVPKGFWLASISTVVETDDPHSEVAAAISYLGPIKERFDYVSDIYEPVDDGTHSQAFISKSYDATSHFVTVYEDIKDIYHRITGDELVIKKRPTIDEEQAAFEASIQ
ncbi:putative secretory pathway GDP dissociation inhibitor 1 [Zancudomyces culisetae]|uniref:Rab GDP dissociation inhibitor n=1 Tax=Zancudomyces culisetae TaxID=1213189 RepID=A0A1R1PGY3_ZANCU|nr:putative secretory pathway GDP dissociation inhibitor 1 [Zancudomyces culisetae]OMH80386.1 putative secretory pathway GDP dissociation inhibitor 1 [Zancudomyces culisetae]|eukprot:OMH80236.1 putative secretory pathway GDP dissociation inhibitor 1 [Zancudomyces culisetae]